MKGEDDDMTPCNADGSLYSGSSTLPLVGDSIRGFSAGGGGGGEGYSPEPPHKPNGTLHSGTYHKGRGQRAEDSGWGSAQGQRSLRGGTTPNPLSSYKPSGILDLHSGRSMFINGAVGKGQVETVTGGGALKERGRRGRGATITQTEWNTALGYVPQRELTVGGIGAQRQC